VRLFVALEIPHSVREELAKLIEEMRAIAPKVKWVRPANLHVTLKFIGHTDSEKLDAIITSLETVRSDAVVDIVEMEFRGLGFFPSEKRARVLWAGVKASANLATLAGEVDRAATTLGFPAETRDFKPHLTLARFDSPGMPPLLAKIVEGNATHDFGVLRTGTFHLIQSRLKPTGAEYTTLRSFPFTAEA
jgi:RNA 2',3'-cyclic 3'-phosphodiesterase